MICSSVGRDLAVERVALAPIHESRAQDFILEDATGRALVNVSGSKLETDLVNPIRLGGPDDLNPRLEAFLNEHGRNADEADAFHAFTELIVADGDIVTVLGIGRRELDPDADLAYRAFPKRLVIGSDERVALSVSNSGAVGELPVRDLETSAS